MERVMQPGPWGDLPRGDAMQTPDEVAAMLWLKGLGWGIRRIARELGCSHMTVRRYVSGAAGYRIEVLAGRVRWLGWRTGLLIVSAATRGTPMWFARNWRPRKA
jgi:Homeodomain-like domain